MKNECVLLVTKDALCKDYLPVYGNLYWQGKTPNINELAVKGTVFNRHYTAAPSTVMAFRAMSTGLFAHEQPYSNYTPKEIESSPTDMFEMAKQNGYEGHLIWDASWVKMVLRYGNCYGSNATIHNLDDIKQGVGCHYKHDGNLNNNEQKVMDTILRIVNEVKVIITHTAKAFIWIHLPHVINGRTAYGSDIDAFDFFIGELRKFIDDNNIFISADHGNMNGYKGKWCYGFDVNTTAVEIPLITPRIENLDVCNCITSNVDIKTLIFNRKIVRRDHVFSDSAYYAQPQRKLTIINDKFAYIYNKSDKTEELYDLVFDRYERVNLLQDKVFDPDRKIISPIREYYFSPHWDDVADIVNSFRCVRDKIWRVGTVKEELKEKYLRIIKQHVIRFRMKFK